MPLTIVHLYRDASGEAPLLAWFARLQRSDPRAYRKCLARVLLLEQKGSELRRPIADALGRGIQELRVRVGRVHYRILYFFCAKNMVCLSHAITKEGRIPPEEIEKALVRRKLVIRDPGRFTAAWET